MAVAVNRLSTLRIKVLFTCMFAAYILVVISVLPLYTHSRYKTDVSTANNIIGVVTTHGGGGFHLNNDTISYDNVTGVAPAKKGNLHKEVKREWSVTEKGGKKPAKPAIPGKPEKSQGISQKAVNNTRQVLGMDASIGSYLIEHNRLCLDNWKNKILTVGSKPLCPCIPSTLIPFRNITFDAVPLSRTIADNPDVKVGGHWEPDNCTARYRIAIIIPFRDRQSHLDLMLHYLLPVLRGQLVNYTIFVVEQNLPKMFNKAALMNIGYKTAMDKTKPDCVIFHDVDFIPEDGRHFYMCRQQPVHLGGFHNSHAYIIRYKEIFGGVTSFRVSTFQKVNGFSNRFFGWGGEDDEMSYRLMVDNKIPFIRDPRTVSGYHVITHERDEGNKQKNSNNMYRRLWNRHSKRDGLNSLRYKLKSIHYLPLYTHLLVDVLNKQT